MMLTTCERDEYRKGIAGSYIKLSYRDFGVIADYHKCNYPAEKRGIWTFDPDLASIS